MRIGYFLADVDKVRLRSSALALKILRYARYCVHGIFNNRQDKRSVANQPVNVRVYCFSSVLLCCCERQLAMMQVPSRTITSPPVNPQKDLHYHRLDLYNHEKSDYFSLADICCQGGESSSPFRGRTFPHSRTPTHPCAGPCDKDGVPVALNKSAVRCQSLLRQRFTAIILADLSGSASVQEAH